MKSYPTFGLCVDGSTLKPNPGISEYRCVDLATGKILFNTQIGIATNNIAEFLAVVQTMIYCSDRNEYPPIYSDSLTAIAWVRNKAYKTMLDRKYTEVFELMDECIIWLNNRTLSKLNKIIHWDTPRWGQIPADYGRH
jgi:ribonuclease HI